MTIRSRSLFLAVAVFALWGGHAHAIDTGIPGTRHWLRQPPFPFPLQYLRSVPPTGGPLFPVPTPAGPSDPTINGGTLTIKDSSNPLGAVTYLLAAPGWSGRGNPAGSTGYDYKNIPGDPCRYVRIRKFLIRARCQSPNAPVITGTSQVTLAVGVDKYCAEFGGSDVSTIYGYFRRHNAAAPTPPCP